VGPGPRLALVVALVALAASCRCRDDDRHGSGGAADDPELARRLAEAIAARGPDYRPRTRHLDAAGRPRYTNRLIFEASPYLLQHAHNPVDWHPWGEEALARARREDRPIFLSIGYSTCHWCHVMEEESFEDEAIAALINQHFVAIKVDREERPDLDAIYLAAVRRLTGSAGWPLTVILLPDRRAVFGGTYFPPRDGPRGVGLATVLDRVRGEYTRDRDTLTLRAAALVAELERAAPTAGELPGHAVIEDATRSLLAAHDRAWGGFGRSPKFPRPAVLQLLLREHRRTGEREPLDAVTRTLERMAAGGIHDHVGGGFHRYAVDDKWRVPHFEKMLYDNAQLATVYLEAHQATGRADFAEVARRTLDFLLRELAAEGGGFHAAIDADSAGEEGTYYVWTAAEIDRVVGAAAGRIVREAWGVTVGGNFEHGANILWQPLALEDTAARLGIAAERVRAELEAARPVLLAARERRVRPHVDRKLLVGWNGLAIGALARGALVVGEPRYRDAARAAASRLLDQARPDGVLARALADGRPLGQGFLDDHAYLAAGLLDLFEADPDPRWLREALALHGELERRFRDPAGGYFRSGTHHERLPVRDKPDHDDDLPAGNSIAALTLLRLAELTGDDRHRDAAAALLRAFAGTLTKAPASLPALLGALDFYLDRARQIVIVSPPDTPPDALLAKLRTAYVPNRVLVQIVDGIPAAPELAALVENKRALAGKPTAYVCIGTHCERPTADPAVFAHQLR
jgi:uncharacterized protein